jgi:hypothetical protein
MSSSTPATYPRRTCGGLVSTCSLACSPANRPAPWRWTSSLGRPGGERGTAACATAKRRPRSAVDIRAQPGTANVQPSVPARPDSGGDDQAARDHRDTSNPVRQRGLSRGTDVRDPAPSGQRGRSGHRHRTPGCPDAWLSGRLAVRTRGSHRSRGHRSPGHRPSTRPGGRTFARRRERRTAWPASGHPRRPRRRRLRLGGPNLARIAASAALGNR